MAGYILGKLLFNECWADKVKCVGKCGVNTVFCAMPCLCCCYHDLWQELNRILSDEGEYNGLLTSDSFDVDPFYALLKTLKKKHGKVHTKLYEKYGLPLGMNDPEVQRKLSEAKIKSVKAAWEDFCVFFKWGWPAVCNGCCCCCCDLTHFEDKLFSGEAYTASHCAWCSFMSSSKHQIAPPSLQYGHRDELVIIMSSPGDRHRWPGLAPPAWPPMENVGIALPMRNGGDTHSKDELPKDKPAPPQEPIWGNMHSWFKGHSEKSEKYVAYCPIQAQEWKKQGDVEPPAMTGKKIVEGKNELDTWSEEKKLKWREHVVFMTGNSRDKQSYLSWPIGDNSPLVKDHDEKQENGEETQNDKSGSLSTPKPLDSLDLWMADWIANVKEAIASIEDSKYRHYVRKVLFVAVMGGGVGSDFERDQLERMDRLFKGRRLMERFIDMAVEDFACCVTCGASNCGFDGFKSAIYWWKRAGAYAIFCSPVRKMSMDLLFVHPSDLDKYLSSQSGEKPLLLSYPHRILPKEISAFDPKNPMTTYHAPPSKEMLRNIIEPWLEAEGERVAGVKGPCKA